MGRSVRYGPVVINNNVTAATPAPTGAPGSTAVLLEYSRRHDLSEHVLLVTSSGITAGDTVTVRPWWYDPTVSLWVRGATTVVTDDGAVIAYCIGEGIHWQVTAVSLTAGNFEFSGQFINKSA